MSFCLQSSPASESFPMSWLLASGSQSIGASAQPLVLSVIIKGWFPLGLIGLISLQSKGLSSLLQHHNLKASVLWHSTFFIVWLSHPYMTTGKTIDLTMWTFVDKMMSLLSRTGSSLVIASLPRRKHLFHLVVVVTVQSDFGAQENKVYYYFHCLPIYTWVYVRVSKL